MSASLLSSQASRRQPARHRHFPVARSQSPWFEHGACSRTLDATASFKVHCGTSQASPGSVDSHSNVPRAGLPPCGACASTGAGAHSSKVTSHPSVVWEQDAFWTVGSELIARPHVAASSTAGSSTLSPRNPKRSRPSTSPPVGAVTVSAIARETWFCVSGSSPRGQWICSQAAPVTPGWQMQNEVERVASGAEQ